MAFQRNKGSTKSWRIFKNEDIKAFTILVIGEDGEQIGTMTRAKALALAGEKGLDLVQINYDPKTKICTAKVVDFGKYQYEKKKAESEKRKKSKSMLQKEIKFGYNIGDHDLDMKVKKGIEFLDKGHPLKVNVVLRGREKAYKDIVRAKLNGVEDQLKEYGKSQGVKSENFGFTLLIIPSKRVAQQKQQSKDSKRRKEETEAKIAKKAKRDAKTEGLEGHEKKAKVEVEAKVETKVKVSSEKPKIKKKIIKKEGGTKKEE